jgi:ABC-type amino acid transport substrate-binding protein
MFNAQKALVVYSGVLTLAFAVLLLSGFTAAGGRHARFDTLTVQRIDFVEPDGTLRMVLSNNRKIPGVIVAGHEYPDYGGRQSSNAAGMLFYDAQGTESGGLTFGGSKRGDDAPLRWGHLSFDAYDQDQMFAIDAASDGTNQAVTMKIWDAPGWSIQEYLDLREAIAHLPAEEQQARLEAFAATHPAARLRTLLSEENYPDAPEASRNVFSLDDAAGTERVRLGVDAAGEPGLSFRDAGGEITHDYPPSP